MARYWSMHSDFPSRPQTIRMKAIIVGLKLAIHIRAKWVLLFNNSWLIVNKINGEYEAKGITSDKLSKFSTKIHEQVRKDLSRTCSAEKQRPSWRPAKTCFFSNLQASWTRCILTCQWTQILNKLGSRVQSLFSELNVSDIPIFEG